MSSTMLLGGGANMWVTMSPGLSRSISLGSGERDLPHMDHHRQIEEVATSCARLSTSYIVRARHLRTAAP